MPHQCVRCSRIIPLGSKEILEGCSNCKGKFFFYIKEEAMKQILENPIDMSDKEQDKVEKDIREIAGITEIETPVILDIESIRVVGDGKYEIDVVKLFNKKEPVVYKLAEGKYIIDLSSTLRESTKDLKEIRNPEEIDEE